MNNNEGLILLGGTAFIIILLIVLISCLLCWPAINAFLYAMKCAGCLICCPCAVGGKAISRSRRDSDDL